MVRTAISPAMTRVARKKGKMKTQLVFRFLWRAPCCLGTASLKWRLRIESLGERHGLPEYMFERSFLIGVAFSFSLAGYHLCFVRLLRRLHQFVLVLDSRF